MTHSRRRRGPSPTQWTANTADRGVGEGGRGHLGGRRGRRWSPSTVSDAGAGPAGVLGRGHRLHDPGRSRSGPVGRPDWNCAPAPPRRRRRRRLVVAGLQVRAAAWRVGAATSIRPTPRRARRDRRRGPVDSEPQCPANAVTRVTVVAGHVVWGGLSTGRGDGPDGRVAGAGLCWSQHRRWRLGASDATSLGGRRRRGGGRWRCSTGLRPGFRCTWIGVTAVERRRGPSPRPS